MHISNCLIISVCSHFRKKHNTWEHFFSSLQSHLLNNPYLPLIQTQFLKYKHLGGHSRLISREHSNERWSSTSICFSFTEFTSTNNLLIDWRPIIKCRSIKRDASLVLQNGLVGTQASDHLSNVLAHDFNQPEPSTFLPWLAPQPILPIFVLLRGQKPSQNHGSINSSVPLGSTVNSTFLLKQISKQKRTQST